MICTNTFLEAIRNRILYLLVVFGMLVILFSKALGWVLIGEDLKVIADVSLMCLSVFGALITILVGTGLIYKEIDKRTIYVVLSRPVARWQYIIGKYLGLLTTVLVMLAAMSLFFLAYLWMMSSPAVVAQESGITGQMVRIPFGPVIFAVALTFLEMVLLTALAIAFSAASTPILSAVFTFMAYVVGHLADRVYDLALIVRQNPQTGTGSELGYKVLMAAYYVTPNLSDFNVRNEAVHGLTGHYTWGWTAMTILYALMYAAAVLMLGILVFRRRNF